MDKTIAPYGSWKSPITADLITAKAIGFVQHCIDGEDIYWSESRPLDNGRYVIMLRTPAGNISECTPPDFYVRTRVPEYGGGDFTVSEGVIYFCNFKDQRHYRQPIGGMPELLTPEEGYRYADLIIDRKRNRIICIREDHTQPGEDVNTIVSIDLNGNDNGNIPVLGPPDSLERLDGQRRRVDCIGGRGLSIRLAGARGEGFGLGRLNGLSPVSAAI